MRMFGLIGLAALLAFGAAGCVASTGDEVDGEIGAAASPLLTAGTTTVSYGGVKVGCRASQTVSITNAGPGTATITGISSSNGSVFVPGSLPSTLAVNASANLTITFVPASQTGYTGTVSIRSTSGGLANTNVIINVDGTGLPPGPC